MLRINEGYVITDSFHIGTEEIVLGVHNSAPDQYVTWRCSNGDNYNWGHYFDNELHAQKDFLKRAQEELRYQKERMAQQERRRKREERAR